MDTRMPASSEYQDEDGKDLPQCKIKRNYSCIHCAYFTQNPRFYLSHLRDLHGERITISYCSLCLYASRHYQKLVRHMKMVHGSTAEDIPGQSRKRPIIEDVIAEFPALPPLPIPPKSIIDIDNLSYDLKSSRKTLKDFAALYFAEDEVKAILTQMEASDVVEVAPHSVGDALPSMSLSVQRVFGDPKCVAVKDEGREMRYLCGFFDSLDHEKSCTESNERNFESTPLDLSIRWSNEEVITSSPMKHDDSKQCHSYDSENLQKIKLESKFAEEKSDQMIKIELFSNEESKNNVSHKKVFKCPLCQFWASTASRFHVHMVGHQNKKQFKCSMCAYCSNWRWDITKHIRLRAFRGTTHKNARVVMQGERDDHHNYTKYDWYITLMKTSEQGELKKCGEMTLDDMDCKVMSCDENEKDIKQKEIRQKCSPSPKNVQILPRNLSYPHAISKYSHPRSYVIFENKEYKCSQCHFSHSNRDAVLVHVKINHQELFLGSAVSSKSTETSASCDEVSKIIPKEKPNTQSMVVDVENVNTLTFSTSTPLNSPLKSPLKTNDEKANPTGNDRTSNVNNDNFAPFRCWHCHQVSNWKHVIQRHCRLKHSGSIRIEAIDRSIDANNPTYRMLNLSLNPSVVVPDGKQSDQKTDKIQNHKTTDLEAAGISKTIPDISFKDSVKSLKEIKHEPPSPKSSAEVENVSSISAESKSNEISDKLEKCNFCSFASSCHSAMRCHEQSHNRVSKAKELHFEQTKILTTKMDQMSKESISNKIPLDKDSEVNHEMNKNHKDIQLKIKHSKAAATVTVTASGVNLNNYKKKTRLAAASKSSHKTILVNPKTGQVVQRD